MTVTTDRARAIARIDELVAAEIAAGGTPGVSIAVTDAERVVHATTAGLANVWGREPVRPDHLFEIGSIGKTFTALALMQLWDEGRLDPDDPVVRHLPWFEARTSRPLTLADLLTHRGGITAGLGEGTPEATVQVWALRDQPEGSEPGIRFHYSNLGYKILGLVIEAVDGRPYPEAIQVRVLDSLGMSASEPAIRTADRFRFAVGHARAADDRIGHPGMPFVPATWLETDTADGSIASTAADMTALARLLLGRGEGPRGRLISERAWERMATSVPVEGDSGYGFALSIRIADDRTVLGHNGGMVGYVSTVRVDLAAGFGVIVLMNGPGSPVELGRAIMAVLRDDPSGGRPAAVVREAEPGLDGGYVEVGGRRRFTLATVEGALCLQVADGTTHAVESWDDRLHLVPHADWDRFLLVVDRASDGSVVIWHGEARFVPEGIAPPPLPAPDPALLPHRGQYRSHDPWTPTFRVLLRGDRLWLQFPEAPDGAEPEQPLMPMPDGTFRLGDDEAGPERLRFDLPIGGVTRRAWLGTWPWYRVGD